MNLDALESELRNQAYKHFQSVAKKLETLTRQILVTELDQSSVFKEIRNRGPLLGELGLTQPEQRLTRITDAILDSVQTTTSVNNRGELSIKVEAIESSYAFLIGLPEAEQHSKESTWNYLQWLLYEGQSPVVVGFYSTTPNSYETRFSRTGLAIMRQKSGANFSLQNPHAGTQYDNFLTRTCERCLPEIEQVIRRLL